MIAFDQFSHKNLNYKMRLLPIACLILLSSCAKYYTYDIRMMSPTQTTQLTHEDDTMSITFDFEPKWINFELYNKSNDGIKIMWDEVSMSENGKAHRIIHKNTGTLKITEVQPPTSVPPRSKMIDQLIPSGSISYSRYSGITQMNVRTLYPITDGGDKKIRKRILNMKGQMIVIYFPYYVRNQYSSRNFEFLISDVRQVSKSESKKTIRSTK